MGLAEMAAYHSLDLQLYCPQGHRTPVRMNLGWWPRLPLVIDYFCNGFCGGHWHESLTPSDEDDAFAALEDPERVCSMPSSSLKKMTMAMRIPFPEPTQLCLSKSLRPKYENMPPPR